MCVHVYVSYLVNIHWIYELSNWFFWYHQSSFINQLIGGDFVAVEYRWPLEKTGWAGEKNSKWIWDLYSVCVDLTVISWWITQVYSLNLHSN